MNITERAIQTLKEIRANKSEQQQELDQLWHDTEVVRQFNENGYVLMWATVLDDYVAYYHDDDDLAKVPSGFVPYSYEELVKINEGDLPEKTLKYIHKVKKITRMNITSIEDDGGAK